MKTHREFLAAAHAGIFAASALFDATEPQGVRIGCQTNAWRIDPNDFNQVLAVLRQLKTLGFEGFETGFRNAQGQFASATSARKQIEQTGLQFFATHHKRITGLHLRDFKGDVQVPLGLGEFPLAQLAAEIKKADWTGWVLNEEERLSGEKPGESAVVPARQALRRTFGR